MKSTFSNESVKLAREREDDDEAKNQQYGGSGNAPILYCRQMLLVVGDPFFARHYQEEIRFFTS